MIETVHSKCVFFVEKVEMIEVERYGIIFFTKLQYNEITEIISTLLSKRKGKTT